MLIYTIDTASKLPVDRVDDLERMNLSYPNAKQVVNTTSMIMSGNIYVKINRFALPFTDDWCLDVLGLPWVLLEIWPPKGSLNVFQVAGFKLAPIISKFI